MAEPTGAIHKVCGGEFWRNDEKHYRVVCIRCGTDIRDVFRKQPNEAKPCPRCLTAPARTSTPDATP